jgi:hypothetical protein
METLSLHGDQDAKHHCLSIRMAQVQNWQLQMLEKTQSSWTANMLLVGMQKPPAALERVWQYKKIKPILATAIPLLGINPGKIKTYPHKEYYGMFIAALFMIAKNCKQLKCP